MKSGSSLEVESVFLKHVDEVIKENKSFLIEIGRL
jgi:hypothetical protein